MSKKLRDFTKPIPSEEFCALCGEKRVECESCFRPVHECSDCDCNNKDCPCCLTGVCTCDTQS
jgi:hypothetical protein